MKTIELIPEQLAHIKPVAGDFIEAINNSTSEAEQLTLLKDYFRHSIGYNKSIVATIRNIRKVSTLDNYCLQEVINLIADDSAASFIDYLSINRELSNKTLNVTVPATYPQDTLSNEIAAIINKKDLKTAIIIAIILKLILSKTV